MNANLLKIFKRSKLTNYRLAKESGVSQSTIGRWVRGETELSLSSAEKIAACFGLRLAVEKMT